VLVLVLVHTGATGCFELLSKHCPLFCGLQEPEGQLHCCCASAGELALINAIAAASATPNVAPQRAPSVAPA